MSVVSYRRGGRQMNLSASKGGDSSNQDLSTSGADGPQSYQDCSQEINRLNDEDLEAYRRMHMQTEESKHVGAKTLGNLNEQGEKLDKINKRLDKMDDDLDSVEEDIDRLNKCCGCLCPNKSSVKTGAKGNLRKNYRKDRHDDSSNSSKGGKGWGSKKKKKKKKGEEEEEPRDAREAEMMEHDRAIDKNISELKQQAVAMNKELDRQNKQIEVTKQHAKYNAARIRGVNRGAEDILDGGGNQK